MSGTALFLFVGFLVVLGAQNIYSQSAEEPSTTCWFLHKYGYDCEKHSVTTSDGYILNMFRVLCPNSNVNATSNRPVALLMHGLPCSSTIWVISPETGLGMSMCDSGYDVWLGNVRGTQYSDQHVSLPTDGPDFWKFSFTEMGMKDLPAMIQYTLDHTGQKNLHFVGHSQGASTYFIYAATDPTSAASSISSAHLLAPVAYVEHTQSPAFVIGAPQIGKADPTSDVSEVKADLVPLISQVLGKQFCENSDPAKGICQELFDTVFGTSNLVNKTIYADVLSTLPDGASLRNVKHSLQEKVSGKFCDFDFGEELNMKKYGTAQPTEFPLEAITVPTYMYYSDNDDLVNLQDYQKIVDRLNSNAKKTTRLYKGYAHMDFIMANNVKEDLHKIILQDMQANI